MVESCTDGGYLANLDLVVDHPRLWADRAEGNDGYFAWVQDRGSGVYAEDSDVGDGDGSILHLGRRRFAFAGCGGQLLNRLGEFEHRHLVGVLDVWNNQAARRGSCDTEVHEVVNDDLFGGEG